jgi:hypothetical protein
MPRSSTHAPPRTAEQSRSRGITGDPSQRRDQPRREQSRDQVREQSRSPSAATASVGDEEPFKLYVPHVHTHIPSKMVFSVFRKLGIGKLCSGEEAVRLIPRKARGEGKRDYNSAVISFDHPFLRGRDGETNAGYLNHIARREDDGSLKATGESFSLVYQEARTHRKTGKPEPERTWSVRLWEPVSTSSTAAAPARPKGTLVHKDTSGAARPRIVRSGAKNGFASLPVDASPSPEPTAQQATLALDLAVARGDEAAYHAALDSAATDASQDQVIDDIAAERSWKLATEPTYADGDIANDALDGELQAAGEEFVAEQRVADAGAGAIDGTPPLATDIVHRGVPMPYAQALINPANGSYVHATEYVDDNGQTVAALAE